MTLPQWVPIVGVSARQERLLASRARWTSIFAGVFSVLALLVAASGYILTGGTGLQTFARTTASLVQLVLLLVPLTALLVGVLALVPERGTSDLLYSQPIPRGTILLGRMLGLLEALTARGHRLRRGRNCDLLGCRR
jgi:Cu-processing system permease protein